MDINYDELFGIEPAPAAEEAPAEPAEESQEQPAQEQPVEGEEQPAEQGEVTPPVPKEMSKEERARQAEGRRIREREARAREEGRAAERAHFSEIVKRMGWTNPKTQQPITNADEFEAYDKELTASRFAAGNPTESDVRVVVQDEIAKATAPRQAEPQISPMEDPRIQAELAQLSALDPDAKDLKSILTGPYGDKFRGYVAKGLSFVESYKLAAEEKLSQRRSGQAAEAARIKAASKEHLSATGTRGQGAISVPPDEMALFREFLPNATPEEIQAYYNQDRKRYGPK